MPVRQDRSMRLRMATLDDVQALAALRLRFRTEEGTSVDAEAGFVDRFSAFSDEALAGGRWTVWVAEADDGSLVSNVWVYRVPKVPARGRPPATLAMSRTCTHVRR
jgi:hypothetical protein